MSLKGRILVYSIVGCRHCKAAKQFLTENGLPYIDVSIDRYKPTVGENLRKLTGVSTVPQIFFNERFIGGNAELEKLVKEEAWKEMLDYVTENSLPENAPKLPSDDDLVETKNDDAGENLKCEPDEQVRILEDFDKAGCIGDNRKGLFIKKRTFYGHALVGWLQSKYQKDAEDAVKSAQSYLDSHYLVALNPKSTFDPSALYRLIADDDSCALNSGDMSECITRSVDELGEDIRKLALNMYNKFLSDDGKSVDYAGIAKSDVFKKYKALALQLQRAQIENATRDQKLAFFINIYNALVIHANVEKGAPSSLFQRYQFFNYTRYIIGGESYSLLDIENGVLRANRKAFSMFRPFGTSDPRLKVSLERHEPLIHFALVCGAKSCPPIKTYSSDGIMDQLKLAAEAFLEGDDVQVDVDSKTVHLSKIFRWYKEDFGGNNASLLQWIHDNMSESNKKTQLAKLLSGTKVKVAFLPYDWSLNK